MLLFKYHVITFYAWRSKIICVCNRQKDIYIVNTLTFFCMPFFKRRGRKGKKEMERDRYWREGEYEISYNSKLCKENVNLLKKNEKDDYKVLNNSFTWKWWLGFVFKLFYLKNNFKRLGLPCSWLIVYMCVYTRTHTHKEFCV